jgi:peptidoglycan/xylan/chitin deacetylase (PgdA/CDA1 family)
VIKLTRRRIVWGAVGAAMVLVPAVGGWSAGQALRPSADSGQQAPARSAPPPDAAGPARTAGPATTAGPAQTAGPANPFDPKSTSQADANAIGPANTATLGPANTPALNWTFPPPVGWKLSDVPSFAPPPAPEPIVLPPGDRVPFLSRIPVTQPVAFLTIDDGYLKDPEAEKLFAAARIPVTLFLTTDAIHDNPAFFDRLRNYGAVIEAHTISHPELAGRSDTFQRHQICDGADRLAEWYGRRPTLFRPPFGDKDNTTLRVTKECGMKAAFMWKETVDKGKVRYQEGKTVQPGDIILMHFRPAFVKDFLAALHAIHRAGLTPALLEDYVPGAIPDSNIPSGDDPQHHPGRAGQR